MVEVVLLGMGAAVWVGVITLSVIDFVAVGICWVGVLTCDAVEEIGGVVGLFCVWVVWLFVEVIEAVAVFVLTVEAAGVALFWLIGEAMLDPLLTLLFVVVLAVVVLLVTAVAGCTVAFDWIWLFAFEFAGVGWFAVTGLLWGDNDAPAAGLAVEGVAVVALVAEDVWVSCILLLVGCDTVWVVGVGLEAGDDTCGLDVAVWESPVRFKRSL